MHRTIDRALLHTAALIVSALSLPACASPSSSPAETAPPPVALAPAESDALAEIGVTDVEPASAGRLLLRDEAGRAGGTATLLENGAVAVEWRGHRASQSLAAGHLAIECDGQAFGATWTDGSGWVATAGADPSTLSEGCRDALEVSRVLADAVERALREHLAPRTGGEASAEAGAEPAEAEGAAEAEGETAETAGAALPGCAGAHCESRETYVYRGGCGRCLRTLPLARCYRDGVFVTCNAPAGGTSEWCRENTLTWSCGRTSCVETPGRIWWECPSFSVDCVGDEPDLAGESSSLWGEEWCIDGCDGVTCPAGQYCSEGVCIGDPDPCAGSPDPCCGSSDPCCGSSDPACGGRCGDGTCGADEDTVTCPVDCGGGEECVPGTCSFECGATCESDADCAADETCGRSCHCEGGDVVIYDSCDTADDCQSNEVCYLGGCRDRGEVP